VHDGRPFDNIVRNWDFSLSDCAAEKGIEGRERGREGGRKEGIGGDLNVASETGRTSDP
jgi:hypothetical protein